MEFIFKLEKRCTVNFLNVLHDYSLSQIFGANVTLSWKNKTESFLDVICTKGVLLLM